MRLTTNRIKVLRLMRAHGPVDSRGVADALETSISNAKQILTGGAGTFWDTLPLATTTYSPRLEGLEALREYEMNMNYKDQLDAYLNNPRALYMEGWHVSDCLSVAQANVAQALPESVELLISPDGEPALFFDPDSRWAWTLDGADLGSY